MPHTDITVTATIDPAPTEDVGDLLASFRRRLDASDVNKRTIAIYASAVDELTKFLRANGMPLTVRAIRREHIESFLIYLRDERGWKPATRNMDLSSSSTSRANDSSRSYLTSASMKPCSATKPS